MEYNYDKYHRRSMRLKGYDYSQNGAYFVTIITQNRKCIFGDIINNEMRLNDAGKMIQKWWMELKNKFIDIILDKNIVMPNHFHGIIIINPVGAILCNRPLYNKNIKGENIVSPLQNINSYNGLGQYIAWFKQMSTNEYIRGVKLGQFPPFEKSIWQRNYYDHIIRDEKSLNKIREYIIFNPLKWESDKNNPKNL